MVVNHKTKKVNLINVNRNSMAEMDIYNKDGELMDTEVRQICLAHGYGTGHEDSCERQVEAVSQLFNFLQINGYYSLELNGISTHAVRLIALKMPPICVWRIWPRF